MRDFRTLTVWEKAHRLALSTYQLTRTFPKEELYGISAQVRRASVSVAANIAEGCGRTGNGEFQRFLSVAMGSAREVEYLLLLCHDLGLIATESYKDVNGQGVEVQRMLGSLIRKVEAARIR